MKLALFRILIVSLCCSLLVACNVESDTVDTVSPQSKSSGWWQERHQAVLAQDKSDVELVFIGDSITQQWEDEQYGLSIWEQYFSQFNPLNLGFDGDKTQNVLWRIENGELDGMSPKYVVLMIGTNNVDSDSAEEIALGIEAIVDEILTLLPETKVIVHRVFPRGSADNPARVVIDLASELVSYRLVDPRVVFADINAAFEDEHGNVTKSVMYDGVHLTTLGYQIWANALLPHLGLRIEDVIRPETAIPVSNPKTWWQNRHKEKLNAEKSNVELLFIGDSITQHWESDGYGLPIWQQYFDSNTTFNLGFSSDRTQNVLWRIEHGELDGMSPEYVVLMIGTNNAKLNTASDVAYAIELITSKIFEKLPDTKLLLYRIFSRGGADNPARITNDAASEIVKDNLTDERILFVDINERFEDVNGDVPLDIMYDHVHLTTKGYQIWADSLQELLTE